MDGILLINKPNGITSHDVVYRIRKLTGLKVGHAGTLDPLATGLLVVTIGEANKLNQYLMLSKKEYIAEMTFGIETETLDAEGQITRRQKCKLNKNEVEEATKQFIGDIQQIPPKYSAIKKNGIPYYLLARKGIEFTPKKRQVKIYSMDIINFKDEDFPKFEFKIICSKGTYIRSLCSDLGKKLKNCGGHLSKLIRTSCGSYRLDEAVSLEKFNELYKKNRMDEALIKLDKAVRDIPYVSCNEEGIKLLKNGSPITDDLIVNNDQSLESGDIAQAIDEKGRLVAIIIWKGQKKRFVARPKRVLNIE